MRDTLPFTNEELFNWRKNYPTPFYLYDEAGIKKTVAELLNAFSWNEGFREYFAVKACPTPGILRLLSSLGCGFDCASESEIYLAVHSGAKGHQIMFSSNETSDAEYKAALTAGAIINLDDITQIERLESCGKLPDTICMRYNPGEFAMSSDIMGHLYDSKFGMTKVQILEAVQKLSDKGVQHFGIHAMLMSNCLEEMYYPRLAEEIFGFLLEIREKTGISVEFVDLAGGVGIPYKPDMTPVDIMRVGAGVKEVYDRMIRTQGMNVAIFTEMGRYITGPHGYLVTTVIGEKHIYKDYIGLDATACDLMRPAMYGAYHHIVVPGKQNMPADHIYDVVGSLCENNDKFAVDRKLPEIKLGDMLVIEDAGAHSRSMGYNYNGKMRCGEFMVKEDHELVMIRRKETLRDYFSTLDIDPQFEL